MTLLPQSCGCGGIGVVVVLSLRDCGGVAAVVALQLSSGNAAILFWWQDCFVGRIAAVVMW